VLKTEELYDTDLTDEAWALVAQRFERKLVAVTVQPVQIL